MDPRALHRASHRSLLRPVGPVMAGGVDAIVVPAGRTAPHLCPAIELAAAVDCWLVVLCSRQAAAEEVAALAATRPHLRWVAVDLPAGYQHRLLRFDTTGFAEAIPVGDLSVKRNLGLLLARLVGWRSVLFLDDDIRGLRAPAVRRAGAALDRFAAAGFMVREFPDNSVVCHANRLIDGRQDVFVGGSALAVDCRRPPSFFPEIYNEDWLFLFDAVRRRAVAQAGQAQQLEYAPFHRPGRAAAQELGEVLAEGLMGLLHHAVSVEAADTGYWAEFLRRRRGFLTWLTDRAAASADQTVDPRGPAALRSLAEAGRQHAQIRPELCRRYVAAWREDLVRWQESVGELRRFGAVPAALHCLDLADAAVSTASHTARRLEAATAGPGASGTCPSSAVEVAETATVAETAQLGVPGRKLFEGRWELAGRPTVIGPGSEVGHFCVIGEEAQIGSHSVLDAYSRIELGATVGDRVLVIYRASIGARAWIGDDSVVASLVCDGSVVGANCRVFGDLIHRQLDPTVPWDSPHAVETSPVLGDNVVVGWGAIVVGVPVGDGAYVCAGATVTKPVAPGQIVRGVNEVVPPAEWAGPLGRSPYFDPRADRPAGVDEAARVGLPHPSRWSVVRTIGQ